MRRIGKTIALDALVLVLSFCMLFGCTMESAGVKGITEEEMVSRVGKMLDREIDAVMPYIEDDLPPNATKAIKGMDGESIVRSAITEEQGREYIAFCYSIEDAQSPEDVLESARTLVSEEDMALLESKVAESRECLRALYEKESKKLTYAQQRQFCKDLKRLLVKSTVLLTAGIVYACIPKVIFWGKISAACAVAVCAGVVASSVMSVVEYKKFGDAPEQSFDSWLESVTKEPYSAWAISASMIATGSSMKRSPVVTGIVIAMFGIYNVIDEVRPMLKKYNFNV